MLDLVIIGGSVAGCSAAVYAARRGLNFKLITDNIGGEVAMAGDVHNWPGTIKIAGYELAQNFAAQVKKNKVEIEQGWKVEKITPLKNHHIVMAKNSSGETKEYETKAVLIATGIHPRHLGLPNEKELYHQGVTYCSVCDGPLFKGKTTVTVGSGNSALDSALMMGTIAKKAYLISKYKETEGEGFPKGEKILIEKVQKLPNLEIIYGAKTTAILGDKRLSSIKYLDQNGEEKELTVDGLMVHIGMVPNSELAPVDKDPLGQIIIDAKCKTSVPGIYAAGDVTNIPYKQIGIAAGQGITAALASIEYINRWKE